MPSAFVVLARRGSMARRSLAAMLAARPLRVYRSPRAVILDPAAPIALDCEPSAFRQMVRDWPDRDTSSQLVEAIHQLDLKRAAQPPVIEVTVTTPPGGIPRAALARLVQARMAEAGPELQDHMPTQNLPAVTGTGPLRAASASALDDTQVMPLIRPDDETQVIEVRVP